VRVQIPSPALGFIMYENCKIYGPYDNGEDRLIVIIIFPDGHRKTTQYARYLMEVNLGYEIPIGIDINHKDENKLNNDINNLELKEHVIHCSEHSKLPEIFEEFICPECSDIFILNRRGLTNHRHNRKNTRFGPFCSRSCAGKYSQRLRIY
jgi:hypothetical protein